MPPIQRPRHAGVSPQSLRSWHHIIGPHPQRYVALSSTPIVDRCGFLARKQMWKVLPYWYRLNCYVLICTNSLLALFVQVSILGLRLLRIYLTLNFHLVLLIFKGKQIIDLVFNDRWIVRHIKITCVLYIYWSFIIFKSFYLINLIITPPHIDLHYLVVTQNKKISNELSFKTQFRKSLHAYKLRNKLNYEYLWTQNNDIL